jgi:hypothetical protein
VAKKLTKKREAPSDLGRCRCMYGKTPGRRKRGDGEMYEEGEKAGDVVCLVHVGSGCYFVKGRCVEEQSSKDHN